MTSRYLRSAQQDKVLNFSIRVMSDDHSLSQSWCRVPRGAHDQILIKLVKHDQWHRSQKGAVDSEGGEGQGMGGDGPGEEKGPGEGG